MSEDQEFKQPNPETGVLHSDENHDSQNANAQSTTLSGSELNSSTQDHSHGPVMTLGEQIKKEQAEKQELEQSKEKALEQATEQSLNLEGAPSANEHLLDLQLGNTQKSASASTEDVEVAELSSHGDRTVSYEDEANNTSHSHNLEHTTLGFNPEVNTGYDHHAQVDAESKQQETSPDFSDFSNQATTSPEASTHAPAEQDSIPQGASSSDLNSNDAADNTQGQAELTNNSNVELAQSSETNSTNSEDTQHLGGTDNDVEQTNQTLSPDTEQTQAAMLKADLHNGDAFSLIDGSGTAMTDGQEDTNIVLHGNAASRGIAFGRIAFLHRHAPTSDRYTVENTEAELARFESVRIEAISQLSTLYEATVEKLGEQNAVVFQIHQMMLDDPDYVEAIRDTIRNEKVNAEYAVQTTGERFADLFRQMEDNDYMQGRAADVIDVSRRLTGLLTTQSQGFANKTVYHNTDNTEPIILATDDLAPSETVQLDQNLVHAILTSEGSSRSHTVIFARTLGLPAVINIGQRLTPELEGKQAIVDGGSGLVIINPDEKTRHQYVERKRTEDALRARLEQFRGKETRTLTGRKINLYANIGAVSDVDLVKTSDAEGIGLFRSEYIYLSSNDFPSEETQFNIYKETLAGMDGKKVVIRTLDIGADKTAEYFMLKPEENPAMGMRAVRICLTRPEIFRTQLRALYRASNYGTLAIMFPMITSVEEIKECKRLCKEVQEELASEGKPFSKHVELGIMIETPASAIISDILAEHVDFFSIGTNDLIQFTLAVDRQNAELGRFLNPYHRAVIRLIEMTVNNAHKNGIWVGVCGELAADEGFTHELVRMGVDELSVVPSSVLMLRARISTLG